MNKMKKLLSVLLAVLMILSSMSVMASAAKTAYKTVDELKALDAYSPYGQVTRLNIEERTSIVFDALDGMLAPMTGLNMGTMFSLLGLEVRINFTSVDGICDSLDSIKDTFESFLASIAMGIINLGIAESLETGKWVSGMTRDGTAQFTILSTLLDFLSDNTTLVGKVFTDGLDLGMISLGDMSAIEEIIFDLPSMVKGIIFPMLERKDDTLTDIKNLDTWGKGDGNVELAINTFVQNLFVDNRSTTTIKYDVNGNMTSEHTNWVATATGSAAPTVSDSSLRNYYQFSSTTPGSTMTVYHIVDEAEAEALAETPDEINGSPAAYTYFTEKYTYVMTEEVEGSGTYVWRATDDWNNTWSLKYYNDNSPWLPSLKAAIDADTVSIDLTTTSLSQLLYTMIPHVFGEMAPVVLNGSMKRILGEFFGAKYNYVGEVGSDAVAALADSSNAFFTEEQGDYLWEWSNYAVINGNHYYRFEDQIFSSDLSNVNNYFSIINWDYEITEDFMDEFVPANGGSTTDTLLMNTNDFLIKVANEVLVETSTFTDAQNFTSNWVRPTFTAGDNTNLVANIKALAQDIIELAPQHIFGSDYATNPRCYYNLLVSDDNDTVLTGIAAQLVEMIMPSMTLPSADKLIASNAKVGSIIAAAIREFAAYLIPEYNYDALIYADFGTTTSDPDKTFIDPAALGLVTTGHTVSGYWLDVCMTMALDAGFEYIRAFADMGEGTTEWTSFVSYSGYGEDGKTYAAGTTQAALNAQWEGMVDYVIDWALDKDYEWTWKMENLVDVSEFTIDLATAQDPWVKLDTILFNLLPIGEVLNITVTDTDAGCTTKLEQALRFNLILGIVDLNWAKFTDMLKVPDGFVRNTNILDSLATVLKNLINGLLNKVFGSDIIIADITDFDTLANQANLVALIKNLVGQLYTAGVTNNGCDTLFPFLNFILGWKTDPQVIAEPSIYTSFRDGNDYAFQWTSNGTYPEINDGATLIKIMNASSGMLEIHTNNNDSEDHAYDINIKSVTSDASVNTLTFTYDSVVSPYETVDIVVGGTYNGEEAVTVTIEYDYVGKDGQPVGGTQYTSVSFLVSNQYEDANISGRQSGDDDKDYTGTADFKSYVFTEDIYTTVTEYTASIYFVKATVNLVSSKSFESCQPEGYATDCNGAVTSEGDVPTGTAANYFAQYRGQDGGWVDKLYADSDPSQCNAKLYYALDGVTADTEFPYGAYDMGGVGVKYGDDTKVYYIDFIYYNDYDIYDVYSENKNNGYTAKDVTDSAIWTEYVEAWNDIVYYATYPMMTTSSNSNAASSGTSSTDYVANIMPKIPAALERFEAALEAFETAKAEAEASGSAAGVPSYVQDLEAQLALDDGLVNADSTKEKEINFQDYYFYEYFNYADLRTAHRNFIKTYYAPEIMDQYYILNSGISQEELELVIDAVAGTSATKSAAIDASKKENDPNAVSASKAANEEWNMPVNSELLVEDMAARLAYYKTFVNDATKENTDHLQFLNLEIAHIDAQQLVEDDYTADSWAKFQEEYADAQAVVAGTADYATYNSTIYNAKWNLMVAYKNLLLKDNSLIEAGGTATLAANAAIAEEIFASLDANDGAWVVKEGVDYNDAIAQLITALGYNYQAIYTENDHEVQIGLKSVGDLKYNEDGTPMMFNMYADSAYEYLDNDRPNRQSNQAKVNTANNNLEAAIANFESAAKEPNTIMLKDGAPYEAVIDTVNCGDYLGTIYGIDTLGWDDTLEADGALADFLTTAYGDDYLEIVVGDAGVETTGTVINVLDEDGAVVESYVFVYFGDIDMDGLVGLSDAAIAEYYEGYYEGIDTFEQFMAADVDGDGWPGLSDAVYMEYYEGYYEGMPEQADIAVAIVDNGLVYEMI